MRTSRLPCFVELLRARSWADGPVALMGDACHPMMPNLGQGGCQAMEAAVEAEASPWLVFAFAYWVVASSVGFAGREDGYVLTQKLRAITNTSQVPAALEEYYSERILRTAAVQFLSRIASDTPRALKHDMDSETHSASGLGAVAGDEGEGEGPETDGGEVARAAGFQPGAAAASGARAAVPAPEAAAARAGSFHPSAQLCLGAAAPGGRMEREGDGFEEFLAFLHPETWKEAIAVERARLRASIQPRLFLRPRSAAAALTRPTAAQRPCCAAEELRREAGRRAACVDKAAAAEDDAHEAALEAEFRRAPRVARTSPPKPLDGSCSKTPAAARRGAAPTASADGSAAPAGGGAASIAAPGPKAPPVRCQSFKAPAALPDLLLDTFTFPWKPEEGLAGPHGQGRGDFSYAPVVVNYLRCATGDQQSGSAEWVSAWVGSPSPVENPGRRRGIEDRGGVGRFWQTLGVLADPQWCVGGVSSRRWRPKWWTPFALLGAGWLCQPQTCDEMLLAVLALSFDSGPGVHSRATGRSKMDPCANSRPWESCREHRSAS
ncbi:unnamed protein product [Prorocentrum cordatum]|uniref:FAD-binding domain-containing protein n=1 Tax=Prorocentrum cordatum TaxID=2364126 RepID=A0ABN9RQZ6_9DINO|nr:unnamed protein product [Polarella glacialis]